MRKKYLSALLFGALLVTSAGTFTSCKDYDDDINSLKEQVDSQASLTNTLSEQIKALETAAQAAQTSADNALAAAQAASDAAKAAQAAGDEAKAAAETAKAEAEAAKAAAATAKAEAIAEAQKMVEELQKTVETSLAAKVDQSVYDAFVASIVGQIEGINTRLDGLDESYNTLDGVVKALQASMTTAQEDIKKIYAAQSEIQTQIAALEEYKKLLEETKLPAIDGKIDAANTAISNLEKQLEAVNDRIDAIDDKLSTLESNLASLEATVGSNYEALEDKISDLKTELQGEINAEVEAINSTLDNVKIEIDEIYRSIAEINGNIATLHTLVNKILTGLVLKPTLYVDGIEAVEVASYNYTTLILEEADVNEDQSDDAPKSSKDKDSNISVVPEAVVSYYMNPLNAEVDTKSLNKFSFKHSVAATRSINESDLTIDKVEVENDLLNVYFDLKDADNIEDIKTDNKADIIALQYTDGDRTVISDFAALTQTINTDFAIYRDYTADDEDIALPIKAADAVAVDVNNELPTLEIPYTNVDGINLDEYFNVYYSKKSKDGSNKELWGTQNDINKQGFELKYELIGYIAGDSDNTNESQHATVTDNILTVHGVDKAPTGKDREIIGRTPLLRVKLIDNNSENRIAAVGYIKVVITDETKAPVEVTGAKPIINQYTVVCENADVLDNVTAITWLEVENLVLGELNMSKEEFESQYALDVEGNKAKQYSSPGTASTNPIGEIIETTGDDENHETRVLKWSVGNNQAYQLFVTENKTSVSTYVKFTPYKPLTHRDVYVKLTWEPKAINKTPIAEILDSDKKAADWHADNSRAAGFDDLHLQVGNATYGQTCEYQNLDCEQTFVNGPLAVVKRDIKETYSALAEEAKVTYRFAANQDVTKYSDINITVNPAGDEILSGTTTIAEIDANGVISIAKNDVTKAIINSCPSREALDKALDLKVEIVPTTCSPAENLITLENNSFNVKVIKPLFVNGGKIGDMTLNNASTLTQNLALDFEDFNGYNPKEFVEASENNQTMQHFYKVTSIVDAKYETNFTGTWKDVDENDFKVKFTQPTQLDIANPQGGMGFVTLEQYNQSRPNSYQVRITFKITYNWGTIDCPVTFTVNAAN